MPSALSHSVLAVRVVHVSRDAETVRSATVTDVGTCWTNASSISRTITQLGLHPVGAVAGPRAGWLQPTPLQPVRDGTRPGRPGHLICCV